jgi:outer membrane protein assembly factor BamE (lipoprotein component of BamABCDE complex)
MLELKTVTNRWPGSKMKSSISIITCLSLAILLPACESTHQGISGKQLQANLRSLKLGMTSEQVIALIGRPMRVNKTLNAGGVTEQWIYTDSQFWTAGQAVAAGVVAAGEGGPLHEGQLYLYFTNSRLTSIQTQQ